MILLASLAALCCFQTSHSMPIEDTRAFLLVTEQEQRVQSVASRDSGDLACVLLPLGAIASSVFLIACFFKGHVERNEAPQAARSIYLVLTFVLALNYTIVILDSYDLSKTLGLSEATSGRMVGTYMLGACLGAGTMWVLQRRKPQLWRDDPWSALLAGLICQLIGSFLYTWVASKATYGSELELRGSSLPHLLMLARFVGGIGSGSCQQFYVASMLHVTPVAERSEHTSRWVFSGMLALGLGPPIASVLQALNFCEPSPRFDLVGYVQIMVVSVALLTVVLLHPSLADVKDCLEAKEHSHGSPVLVVGCLLMTGLRAFSVSAIEVGIAVRLEKTYEWDQRVTGLVVGAIFLCCIPLRAFHSFCSKSLPVTEWIRVFGCLSVLGSSLLFEMVCRSPVGRLLNCADFLVAAGTVLFPCLYLSDALGSGLMHQHVLAEGSLLDANHTQLWFMLLQGLGRFLGPWLARLCLDLYGQDAFAAGQMAATVTFLFTFESLVRPFVRVREEDDECFESPGEWNRGVSF